MATECPRCRQWLSGGDVIEGYCWNCKRVLTDDEVSAGLAPEGDAYAQEDGDRDE